MKEITYFLRSLEEATAEWKQISIVLATAMKLCVNIGPGNVNVIDLKTSNSKTILDVANTEKHYLLP